MQLLVLVFMLMMSGKNANIKELKPIIEELGGGKAAEAFKQAEELSGMLSAVQSLAGGLDGANAAESAAAEAHGGADNGGSGGSGGEIWQSGGYPLAPIAKIADERITYCLSRYIACGE